MQLFYSKPGSSFAVGNCCAIASLEGFNYDDPHNPPDKEKFCSDIQFHCGNALGKGKSLVVATVTTQQKQSAQLLEECGFICMQSDWAYRDQKVTDYKVGVKLYLKMLVEPQ